MFAELERKITAVIADGVAARPHLRVVAAPSAEVPTDPDDGVVRVALAALSPEPHFQPEVFAQVNGANGPASRRVVRVQFTVDLAFILRPLTDDATTSQASRGRLLDDMALVAHWLAGPEVYSGKAFASAAADPGYRVLRFEFVEGSSAPIAVDGLLTGRLAYRGLADIWPPAVSQAEGVIRVPATTLVPLPLAIVVDQPALLAEGTTAIHIRGVEGARPVDAEGAVEPLRLALTVVSDLPPDQRGRITSGEAGAETGSRIVTAGAGETVVTFQASALVPDQPRTEVVAIHLATPDQRRGLLLGSAVVQTLPGGA